MSGMGLGPKQVKQPIRKVSPKKKAAVQPKPASETRVQSQKRGTSETKPDQKEYRPKSKTPQEPKETSKKRESGSKEQKAVKGGANSASKMVSNLKRLTNQLQPAPMPVQAPVPEVLYNIPTEDYAKLASDQEKKQFLGNYLYQFVMTFCKANPDEKVKTAAESNAGKITGMILEGQTLDCILYLFKDKAAFNKITN